MFLPVYFVNGVLVLVIPMYCKPPCLPCKELTWNFKYRPVNPLRLMIDFKYSNLNKMPYSVLKVCRSPHPGLSRAGNTSFKIDTHGPSDEVDWKMVNWLVPPLSILTFFICNPCTFVGQPMSIMTSASSLIAPSGVSHSSPSSSLHLSVRSCWASSLVWLWIERPLGQAKVRVSQLSELILNS